MMNCCIKLLLEAILGAVAIDSKWNYDVLRGVVCSLTDIYNNMPPIIKDNPRNIPKYLEEVEPVTELKELSEKGRCKPPKYIFEELCDKNNNRIWSCMCIVENCKTHRYMIEGPMIAIVNICYKSKANTKKEAKKKAATLVLNKFYAS